MQVWQLPEIYAVTSHDALLRQSPEIRYAYENEKNIFTNYPSKRLRGPQLLNRQYPATLTYYSLICQTCCLMFLAVFTPKATS